MTERPAPTPLQQAAIADIGRDLFLVAGAGTGKTTVLVDRYCDVVADPDGPGVDGVLAFTFTERAAGELKRRIRKELLRRSEEDPVRRAELRRLARDSEAGWVSTIHGFCQRLLSSHSLAAGLDPRYVVLDDSEARRISQEAFDAAFIAFASAGGDDDRLDMAAAFGVEGLREMVAASYDELRSQGHEHPVLPDVRPMQADEAARLLHEAAQRALDATAHTSGKWPETHREKMAQALHATDGRVPEEGVASAWTFKSKDDDFLTDPVLEYLALCKAFDGRLAEAGFGHYYEYVKELLALYGNHYSQLKLQRSALDFEDLQLRARSLLASNAEIRSAYQRRFDHLMVDEYQDTNQLQASLIEQLHMDGDVPANHLFTVGDELQSIYGFRHADVDVFRRQRRLAEEKDGAADAAGRPSPAGVRLLTGNFRSDPRVLAVVNTVGAHLFGAAFEPLAPATPGAGERPAAEVLVTEIADWPDDLELEGVSPDEHAQIWRVAEARTLASRLAELVQKDGVPRGDIVVLLRSYSHVQAYERALARAGLRPYVVGGRGYWSRQQVTDALGLLACIANPLDDRALLDVLASPVCGVSPDALWLLSRAGRGGPLWWAVRHLFAERQDDEEPAPAEANPDPEDERESWSARVERWGAEVPAEDQERIRVLVARLALLRETAPSLALDALIDRAVRDTGYDLALLMRGGGRRRMANVRKLMRLARDYEADEGRDLRGFLDWARSEADTSRREAEATIQAEGHDGVRIMTIHGSKGLEFGVVAVADLGRGMGSRGAGSALRIAPAEGDSEDEPMRVGLRLARLGRTNLQIFDHKALADAAAEREREEERRLLHVAMTRAERRLILSGATRLEALAEEAKVGEPLMGAVLRGLGWVPGLDAANVPAPAGEDGKAVGRAFKVPVTVTLPEDFEGAGQLQMDVQSDIDDTAISIPPALPDPDMAPPAPPGNAPPVTHVSYSALSLYERCGYRFYVERVLGLGGAPAAAGGAGAEPGGEAGEAVPDPLPPDEADALEHRYARGRVVHELLEASARAGWEPPGDELAAALLTREGIPADAGLARVQGLISGFLGSPLRGELSGAAALHPELPFAFKLGELIVRGEIDLLAELGDEVVVVDYKSDALGDDDPASHMDRYEVQRKIYALAALRRYGLPVRVVYSFLDRPLDPVEQRFEPADVDRLTADLEGAAAGIHAGRFEVTQQPNLPLCFDCPARKRLCSWDETRTLAS